ncbi:MAG: BolA family transcriptional regulator [Parvibaculum sp.]|uniref:BolA family protein n=1 Tax=Parvibaculum sp. TaxID=2024848 RepID=UPI00284EF3E7|nr:BolA family protein [Parvibaculum sp.]MDR3497679.1 BolA family transcriptional regulator [Parvibaculum sp.]
MAVADTIRQKLELALQPLQMTIEDQSHLHKGHAGHRPGGETHFRVTVVSVAFAGVSRIQRHRMVTGALAAEMNNPIHALALTTLTPEEAAKAESEA